MQRTVSTTENVVAFGCDKEEAHPQSNAEVDSTSSGLVSAAIVFFATYGVCKFGEDQGWWKLTDCIDTLGKLVIS